MKPRHKIISILIIIILGVFFIWYFQVYRHIADKNNPEKATTKVNQTIVVSIAPIKYIIEKIVGNDFEISVLVPAGSSPETYDPTPRQMIAVSNAKMLFVTGLVDFECAITSRLSGTSSATIGVLSDGVELLAGSRDHSHTSGEHHTHRADPHIWLSPRCLKTMAGNAYKTIAQLYPDSLRYEANYLELADKLDALDDEVGAKISAADVKLLFIYHHALTYYADDYGLIQVALEQDGKEPSAEQLTTLIALGKSSNIKHVFYQKQFNESVVKSIAGDIGASPVEFDPMKEDVMANILEITNAITR